MRPEELTALLRRQPFIPLRVYLTDGHTSEVRHPKAMMVSRSHAVVVLQQDPRTWVVDRYEYLALVHIVRVEESPHAAPAGAAPGQPA